MATSKKRCTSARHMSGNTWLALAVCYAWTVPSGLRQALRAWNTRLEAELTAHGLVQNGADLALWIMHGGGHVMTIFYVDDGMVAARTVPRLMSLLILWQACSPYTSWESRKICWASRS
jgi:hypothetical protein